MTSRRQFIGGLVVTAGALAACSDVEGNSAAPGIAAKDRPKNLGVVSLDSTALEDALVGSSYLGTGGGGSLAEARALIAKDLSDGQAFSLLPVEALADDDRVACPYGLGSLAPTGDAITAKLEQAENRVDEPVQAAFETLEDHIGQKFAGVIMGEIGPLSLAEGLSTAARLGVPALDADTVGRAVPEINQHSVKVAGIPLTPIGAATPFGDAMVVGKLGDPTRAEDILRAISIVSGVCGVTDSPITGAQAKAEGTLVTGSFSLARRIGEAVRLAKENDGDPIEAAREAGDGYLLFTGTVSNFDWRDEDGFLVGSLTLAGTGDFGGDRFSTAFKNEHLVARRNGEIVATCPDLISVIDLETHDGITNPDFIEGQQVAVIGYRCDPLWRTQAGLAVFSPRYFGYDVDYMPIEERIVSTRA